MAAGKKDDSSSSQLEEPLLPERDEGFTFPPSPHDGPFLTLDVGTIQGALFSPANSFRANDDAGRDTPNVPDTPGHFRSNSSLFRFEEADSDGEEENGTEVSPQQKKVDVQEKIQKSRIKRELRNPIQKKSFVKRAAHTAANEPIYFLKSMLLGLVMWPLWAWKAMVSQMNLTIISLKSGFAAGLASIICVVKFPPPYNELSSIAIWAVVTIDILYEGNIGLSLSKGVNRVAGTLAAGAVAVFLTQLGPDVPSSIYPYYVVFSVFLGGFIFRFLKGIPPLKDQWGYAFTVATIAFHILLLSSYLQPERVTLPLLRFSMILLGFFLASFINLAIKPVYAGDSLHKLVAKNFDTAADVLQRCVTEYANYRILDHVPDILSGRSVDDKIHQSYHEIVMSGSDIDKLLGAVTWEPCHGAFFNGYPWHLYDDITDYLRYTLYDVIALDSCLRASIQAPKDLRDLFSEEMKQMAAECSKVLHMLGESIRTMTAFPANDVLHKAEEAAIKLQSKIYIHTHLLLGQGAAQSPRYPFYVASSAAGQGLRTHSFTFDPNDPWATYEAEQLALDEGQREETQRYVRGGTGNGQPSPADDERTTQRHPRNYSETCRQLSENEQEVSPTYQDSSNVSRSSSMTHSQRDPVEAEDREPSRQASLNRTEDTEGTFEGIQVDSGLPNGDHALPKQSAKLVTPNLSELKKTPKGWRRTFKRRRSKLGDSYAGAEERISALSLVKFASLLIEVVVKMNYVVTAVVELGEAARFKVPEYDSCDEPSLRDGIL
ncbi:hypothetical protein R1sor_015566 [Riccia sorocarpa]|uniref:Aluminum-activated malate transporter n=1 Tax=Riccia sorocarpa TaxID=122646 RepID=A0ABD3HFA7_9MARC